MAKNKAGPVVTDNGGLVLDWFWDKKQTMDWERTNTMVTNMNTSTTMVTTTTTTTTVTRPTNRAATIRIVGSAKSPLYRAL